MPRAVPQQSERVDWVDHAKAISILLVVAMHSTLGVSARMGDAGWMERMVEWAEPFRIPAFFLTAGLFLHRSVDRSWRVTLDGKVVHFAYFYVLWLSVQFLFKAPAIALDEGWNVALRTWAMGFVQPFGTLWFITVLPLFFLLVKAAHRRVPPAIVLCLATLAHVTPIHSGWILLDEGASRFVFFAAGALLAPQIFALAEWVRRENVALWIALAAWACLQTAYVANGWAGQPVVSLALGGMGAMALVAVAVRLCDSGRAALLAWIGRHTLPIYLAFFLPMAVSRTVLVKLDGMLGFGSPLIAFVVTASAVAGSIVIFLIAQRFAFTRFLFTRPNAFKLAPPMRPRTA